MVRFRNTIEGPRNVSRTLTATQALAALEIIVPQKDIKPLFDRLRIRHRLRSYKVGSSYRYNEDEVELAYHEHLSKCNATTCFAERFNIPVVEEKGINTKDRIANFVRNQPDGRFGGGTHAMAAELHLKDSLVVQAVDRLVAQGRLVLLENGPGYRYIPSKKEQPKSTAAKQAAQPDTNGAKQPILRKRLLSELEALAQTNGRDQVRPAANVTAVPWMAKKLGVKPEKIRVVTGQLAEAGQWDFIRDGRWILGWMRVKQ